jgi:hypothetical protein
MLKYEQSHSYAAMAGCNDATLNHLQQACQALYGSNTYVIQLVNLNYFCISHHARIPMFITCHHMPAGLLPPCPCKQTNKPCAGSKGTQQTLI